MFGLGCMQAGDQRVKIRSTGDIGCVVLDEMADTLLATGDRQEFSVEFFIPVPVQPVFGKGKIEGDAMAVTLGIGQRAINVEDQCLQCFHGWERYPRRGPGKSHEF